MSSLDLLDQSRPVRSGEELDHAKLAAYLKQQFPAIPGELEIEQFPRGYSNLTYLVRLSGREMVLRRPPFGAKIRTAHDMGREYRILSHICGVFPKVPRPLAYCQDETVLGAPFYLMERVKGVILRAQPPSGIDLAPDRMRRLSESFVENLVEIHAIDYAHVGLQDLGKPEGYVTRQVEGWSRRYQNARTDEITDMESLAQWLVVNKPAESGACLIHNDYKYDNLVLDPADLSQVITCLDWEMATIGDPLMDLGSTLGYWVDADDPEEWRRQAFGITTLPGNMNREEVLQRYGDLSGRELQNAVFYYAYGLFKIGVIVQQIYARFKQGLTRDERFARLIDTVRAGSRMGLLAIEQGRISRLDGHKHKSRAGGVSNQP